MLRLVRPVRFLPDPAPRRAIAGRLALVAVGLAALTLVALLAPVLWHAPAPRDDVPPNVWLGTLAAPPPEVPMRDLAVLDLFLARPYNVVRRMVDEAFAGIGLVPRVVAEIESDRTLEAVIAEGLGATILPASMAVQVTASCDAWSSRIVEPEITAPLALCQSDHLPLSEPAQAVKAIVLALVAEVPGSLLSAAC